MSELHVELTEEQFLLLKEDPDLEQIAGNTYAIDLRYLAQKVVGHDKALECEATFDVVDKGENKLLVGLDVNFWFIDSDETINDEDYKDIFNRALSVLEDYKN